MANTVELARLIGKQMLADQQANGAPRMEAANLIRSLLEVNGKAKLPALLAKAEVRAWMKDMRVTETMLREAFAAERKLLREKADSADLKIPARRRKKVTDASPADRAPRSLPPAASKASAPAKVASLFDSTDDGMVPN